MRTGALRVIPSGKTSIKRGTTRFVPFICHPATELRRDMMLRLTVVALLIALATFANSVHAQSAVDGTMPTLAMAPWVKRAETIALVKVRSVTPIRGRSPLADRIAELPVCGYIYDVLVE